MGDYITNIVVDFFTSITNFITMVFSFFLCLIDAAFDIDNFKPSINYFKEDIVGITTYSHIKQLFKYIGFTSAGFLFIVGFFVIASTGGLKETKDSISTLIQRAIIAVIMVTISMQFLDTVQDCVWEVYSTVHSVIKEDSSETDNNGNSFWTIDDDSKTTFLEQAQSDIKSDSGGNSVETSDDGSSETEAIFALIGVTCPEGFAVGGAILILLGIIFGIIKIIMGALIVFNYFKLIVELIRRYCTFAIMHFTFPAICGTIASGYTVNIFWTYLRGYVAEGICLMMTEFFLMMTHHILNNMTIGLISTFIIIAFINIGLQLDNFMREKGFSASTAGGNLAQGVIASAISLGFAARGMQSIAGSTGSVMLSAAAVGGKNNMALATVGSVLSGQGASAASVVTAMNSSFAGRVMEAMPGLGGSGYNTRMSASEQQAMVKMFSNGGRANMEAFTNRLNTLGADGRNAVFGAIQDSMINSSKAGAVSMAADGFAKNFGKSTADSLKLSGIDKFGNLTGTVNGKMGETPVTIGSTALNSASKKFTTPNGDDMYVTFGKTAMDSSNFNGISMGNIVDDMSKDSLSHSEFGISSKMDVDTVGNFFDDRLFDDPLSADNWKYEYDSASGNEYLRYDGVGDERMAERGIDEAYVAREKDGTYTFTYGNNSESNIDKLLTSLGINSDDGQEQ